MKLFLMKRIRILSKKVRFCLDGLLIVLLIVFDQFTKKLAVSKLMGKPSFIILKNVLEFDYLENRGVAFGMLQGQKIFILLAGFIFIAALMFFMIKMPQGRKYTILHIILSFVIAGGAGNIIDRVSLGYVIDFISFVLIDFPIFNVADCYVVCGVIAMSIVILFVFADEDFEFMSFKKSKEKKV